MLAIRKRTMYSQIMTLSAWGFAIVIASFFFLYIGYHIDGIFGTTPSFMFGLFLLGVGLCIGRLYQDAWMMLTKKR